MNVQELLKNEKVKGLSGNAFKALCVLLSEANDGKIEKFTILGLSKKWKDNSDLNMVSGKNTVKGIIRELESLDLIRNDKTNRTLHINV